jgi:mono/diheme cytochrome c family protein
LNYEGLIALITAMALGLSLGMLSGGCSSSRQPAAPVANAVSADPAVDAILTTSCFQCHSNRGSAPWYAAVSPTYLAANSARGVLNFSDWQSYDADQKVAELKRIAQSVGAGSMPPGDYTALDHSARLSEDQKQILLKWAAQPAH